MLTSAIQLNNVNNANTSQASFSAIIRVQRTPYIFTPETSAKNFDSGSTHLAHRFFELVRTPGKGFPKGYSIEQSPDSDEVIFYTPRTLNGRRVSNSDQKLFNQLLQEASPYSGIRLTLEKTGAATTRRAIRSAWVGLQRLFRPKPTARKFVGSSTFRSANNPKVA